MSEPKHTHAGPFDAGGYCAACERWVEEPRHVWRNVAELEAALEEAWKLLDQMQTRIERHGMNDFELKWDDRVDALRKTQGRA